MTKDLEVIKELEKAIGKKLEQKPLGKIMDYGGNGYAVDGNDFVIGLNLDKSNISDLQLLNQLTRLTHLSLYYNKISDVSPLQGLTALKVLNLSSNQPTDVSPLQGLTALTTLGLDSNQLTDVSPLQGLTALTDLYLYSNQLTDVSPLQGLTALTTLDLSSNLLTDVSPLQGLTALTELYLDSNQLTDVSPLQGLKQLKILNLRHNKISQLPEAIFHLGLDVIWDSKYDWFAGLHLYGNPLETPPVEVVKQGKEAVLNYFKELEKDSVHLLQCKLLIVGNGEVGKTTLMKKLLDPNYPVKEGEEDSTHGINIKPWHLDVPFTEKETAMTTQPVTLHFWDFGGQDIYHATHQFFLTKRSLYLFVWEARREEETRSFDYWLNILKLLSDQSPVIMVMNKADKRTKFIDEKGFKNKFPNIQNYTKISCVEGTGIHELTEEIRRNLADMPHLQDKLPLVWVQIRDRLDKEKQVKNYITQSEYFSICQEYGLNQERALFLSDYLHDLGVIIHYGNDPQLKHTVILNPEWATEAVYILIFARDIQENRGNFRRQDLKRYWPEAKYPEEKHGELVRLMEKFELCFNFADTPLYFVPELLPPADDTLDLSPFQSTGTLRFHYHYDFMPEGIVSRFMARFFYLIDENHFWKNGVILKFEESKALIMGEPLNRRVTITITGNQKKELLAIMRHHFDFIHTSLNMEKNNHYHEMIPCFCSRCASSPVPYFYKYDMLKYARAKNITDNVCQNSFETVSIAALLEGFEPPAIKGLLVDNVMRVLAQLQANAAAIREDEDSRNSIITMLLPSSGYVAKDQTRSGYTPTGKSAGRLDIMILNQEGQPEAIIEALRLNHFNRNTINSHVQKIFKYDINGLPHNFMLVYAESADFIGLWNQYLGYLPQIEYKYKRLDTDIPQDETTPYTGIRVARTRHERDGRETVLYHLFVDMFREIIR